MIEIAALFVGGLMVGLFSWGTIRQQRSVIEMRNRDCNRYLDTIAVLRREISDRNP